jgi:glutathione S-transferase
MLSLYHSPNSRSSRIIWLCEELEVDYQIVYCSILRGIGLGARDPANPHPDKRVPALVHDGALVTESAAIALYLTDLMPSMGLGPGPGMPSRGEYISWLAYYAGEAEPAFAAKLSGRTEVDPIAAVAFDRVIRRVFLALEAGDYLLGESFSAADILFASLFQWHRDLAPESDDLDAWLERLAVRPAAQRATEKDILSSANPIADAINARRSGDGDK